MVYKVYDDEKRKEGVYKMTFIGDKSGASPPNPTKNLLKVLRAPPAREEKKGLLPPNTKVNFKVSWGASVYIAAATLASGLGVAMQTI